MYKRTEIFLSEGIFITSLLPSIRTGLHAYVDVSSATYFNFNFIFKNDFNFILQRTKNDSLQPFCIKNGEIVIVYHHVSNRNIIQYFLQLSKFNKPKLR